MNEAAKNISELLSGDYGKTIVVGGKIYVIKAPVIKVMARATKYFADVDVPENVTVQEMMKIVSAHTTNIIKGLSYLIVGNVKDYELQSEKVAEKMQSGTKEELCSAFLVAFELIMGRDFFAVCQLAMELAKLMTRPKL